MSRCAVNLPAASGTSWEHSFCTMLRGWCAEYQQENSAPLCPQIVPQPAQITLSHSCDLSSETRYFTERGWMRNWRRWFTLFGAAPTYKNILVIDLKIHDSQTRYSTGFKRQLCSWKWHKRSLWGSSPPLWHLLLPNKLHKELKSCPKMK